MKIGDQTWVFDAHATESPWSITGSDRMEVDPDLPRMQAEQLKSSVAEPVSIFARDPDATTEVASNAASLSDFVPKQKRGKGMNKDFDDPCMLASLKIMHGLIHSRIRSRAAE